MKSNTASDGEPTTDGNEHRRREYFDSTRIELSPDVADDGRIYVITRDKGGTLSVYLIDPEAWDNIPDSGGLLAPVFHQDVEDDLGGEKVDVDPYEVTSYELAVAGDTDV